MAQHPEGPETHCYDAVESRAFVWDGLSQVAVLRSLEVEYSYFDHNPAVAATCVVATQSFESFLSHGAGAAVPDAIQAQVRAHLLSKRTPGSSTWVSVDFESLLAPSSSPAGAPCPVWWGLTVDSAAASHPGFPGPSYAGAFEEQAGAGRSALRQLLVTPGSHTVEAHVTVRFPALAPSATLRVETVRASVDTVFAAGQHVALRCVFDPERASATLMPALSRGA